MNKTYEQQYKNDKRKRRQEQNENEVREESPIGNNKDQKNQNVRKDDKAESDVPAGVQ
jgi:hypothetical protein